MSSKKKKKQKEKISERKSTMLIYQGIGTFFAIIIILFIIFLLTSGSRSPRYEGIWTCSDGDSLIEVTIDEEKFTMKSENVDIEATYKISYEKAPDTTGNLYKYGLIMDANRRVIDGQAYIEPYSTEYELDIEEDDDDTMIMINSISYSIYSCSRKK